MNTEIALEIVKICQGFIDWGNPEKESDKQALVSKLSTALASVNANEQSQAQHSVIPHDFYTHQQSWRGALVIAESYAKVHAPDVDDKAYWRHELAAFDMAFDSLPPAPMNEVNKPEGEAK